MKEPALVLIKPDGISKGLVGSVFLKFAQSDLEIVAVRIAVASRNLAEKHYKHLRGKPFFEEIVDYLAGEYHKNNRLIAVIYYGSKAIEKCRQIAGATNPEEAAPQTIRGSFGRITTKGVFENVVHVSSDKEEAEREIKLWFEPDEILAELYPTKTKNMNAHKKRVWL